MAIYNEAYLMEQQDSYEYRNILNFLDESSRYMDYILNEKSYSMVLNEANESLFKRAWNRVKELFHALVEWFKKTKQKVIKFAQDRMKAIKERVNKYKSNKDNKTNKKPNNSKTSKPKDLKVNIDNIENGDPSENINVVSKVNSIPPTVEKNVVDKSPDKVEDSDSEINDTPKKSKKLIIDANYIINYAKRNGFPTFDDRKNKNYRIRPMIEYALSLYKTSNDTYEIKSFYNDDKNFRKSVDDNQFNWNRMEIADSESKIKELKNELDFIESNGFGYGDKSKEKIEFYIERHESKIKELKELIEERTKKNIMDLKMYEKICYKLPGIIDMILRENGITS